VVSMAVNPEEVARWLAESCESQGVPLRIVDPVVLRDVAVLLGGRPEHDLPAADAA
jgi:hypothetical protein